MKRPIREVIESNALKLRYHPRVDPAAQLVGVHVEVVWDTPGDFDDARHDVADSVVDLVAMTRWAIVRAGDEIGQLNIPFIGFGLPSSVMSEPALADELVAAAREGDLSPRRVELLLWRFDDDVAKRLSRAGFNLAAGGVGGGDGPSLVELVEHPFDAVWLHRRLIDGLPTQFSYAVLVRSLVQLGHSLELRVVASGVDDQRSLAYLRELGCDQIQGDTVGPPTDAAGIRATLTPSVHGVRVMRIM